MEQLLTPLYENGILVVVSLVALILLVLAGLFYYYWKNPAGATNSKGLEALDEVEGVLRRVLEDHQWEMEAAAMPAKDAGEFTALEQRITGLQEELKSKEEQLNSGEGGFDASEKEGLLGRMRELEEKLAEYAIIEDDIADLSTYKKENEKLKDEINRLQTGESVVAAPIAITSSEPEPVVAVEDDVPIEQELNQSMEEEAMSEVEIAPRAPEPAAEPPAFLPEDDVFGEFEKVVKNQSADQVLNQFSKGVKESTEPALKESQELGETELVEAVADAEEFGHVDSVESIDEEGSAYQKEGISKDSSQEAELFVKDFQGLFKEGES